MKRVLILLLGLMFGLVMCATEKFDTLNVEVPCQIKIFEAEDYSVRILDKKGRASQDVTWEIKNNVLEIKGDVLNEKEVTVIIFTPIEQKIQFDHESFTLKEKK